VQRLRQAASHDRTLDEVVALIDEAKIRVVEASRALRAYRERLDLDPAELVRTEERIAAIHHTARKYRVRPEALPELAAETEAKLVALAARGDSEALLRAEKLAKAGFFAFAEQLSAKRQLAAAELGHRVTAMMGELAMAGGRLEIALTPLAEPASFGL